MRNKEVMWLHGGVSEASCGSSRFRGARGAAFGKALAISSVLAAGEPRSARTLAAASEGFEAHRSQRARAVMVQTQCITAYKLSSLRLQAIMV